MALQLSREQGITLRGSAEIVAEFFCKFSSCEAEGGESRAQAARRPAARPERPRIPALVPRPPVPAGGIRKWGGGRRLRSCCFRQRRRPGRCRGPPCGGAPLRERFFPMQSSSHTPRPQRRVASRVDRDGLDFGKSCSELGQVYLLTEPGKTAFGINSILYQRGLYPSETFTRVQKYGLTLLVTTDPELIKYLNNVDQLKDKDLVVPEKWEESGPQFITNSEEVRLRSFTTTIHKVNSVVAYTIPVND